MEEKPLNKVELLGYYGGDETHALSAWTSTSRELTQEKRDRMYKLIQMLATQGHHTPFEKSYLHFLVCCDTASHIHLIKHRIGVSINVESARYKQLRERKYYTPSDWPESLQRQFKKDMEESFNKYEKTLQFLVDSGISRKRAKESARFYLPYASQVYMDVGFNWRSFAHFLNLRDKPDAQVEIREIAIKMLALVEETKKFDLTIQAFREGGLIG